MDDLIRMQELVASLNRYARLYYEQDAPVVSDAEYDALYDELRALESKSGITLDDSPTKRVGGAPQKKFEQSKHMLRLYSLDKCQTAEEFFAWCDRIIKAEGRLPELTCECKFDGLTLNLLYEGGRLVKATTRGDGETGEVVTRQVMTIKQLPQEISYKGAVEIQGEGIMRLSALERYNATADVPLKNARNGVAGAIRNLDPEVTRSRELSFFAYNIGYGDRIFSTQSEMRDFIREQGFETEGKFEVVNTADDALKYAADVENMRDKLDYLIDGVVFKVNDCALREELGYTEKFPKWAVAYKFKAEEMTTVLRDVVWQVSRSAKLNPLAVLDAVDIGGVTVRHATLNNFTDIRRKGVKIGDRVFIRRSNDVIPEITGVAESYPHSQEIEKPVVCPSCGAPVREEGAFLYCTNEHCAPQIIASLAHFASKDAMDIEGFSEKTAELFFNELGIKDAAQLMSIEYGGIVGLDGFQDKKAKNLISAIERSKTVSADRFLYAIGIDGIGKKIAKDLIKRFRTLKELMRADKEELTAVDGVGDVLADNILTYFADEKNLDLISRLFDSGIKIEEAEERSGALSGMRVVLTGSLPTLKRGEAVKLIEDNGGEAASSVSKTVDLVVCGEDAGSKLEKAVKLGIRVIDEAEFLAMIEGGRHGE